MKKETAKAEQDDRKLQIENAYTEEAKKYPGPAFSRGELANLLGISVGYLANLDSRGEGPEGGYHSGRKKMYLKKPAIGWGIRRVKVKP